MTINLTDVNDEKRLAVFKDLGVTVVVTHDVQVDPGFADFLLNWPDIFGSDYIGYWGFGVKRKAGSDVRGYYGWFVVEVDEEGNTPSDKKIARVCAEYEATGKLPEGWHLLDLEAVRRIVADGVKEVGPNFQEDYDGNSLDNAIQKALLGRIVYG